MSDVWDYLIKNPPKLIGDKELSHAEQFFGARDYFSRY